MEDSAGMGDSAWVGDSARVEDSARVGDSVGIDNSAGYDWVPDPDLAASSNATEFMQAVGADRWEDLVRLGDEEPERFHDELLRHVDFQFFRPYDRVMNDSKGPEWVRWCEGGTTNVVLNVLDRWRNTPVYDKEAVVWDGEDGTQRSLTYRALDVEVCRLAGGLRSLDLGTGDVIAVYMPNVPEAVVAMLAIAKIGAVVMPLFSGFGVDAVAARLETGEAKAVVTIDASLRRGRLASAKDVVDEAIGDSATAVVVLRHSGSEVSWDPERDHWWHELCDGQPDDAPTTEVDAEAPYLLVFTSGTTGAPKGVVHTHIGFTAKLALDLWLMLDLKQEDRVLWMSDMGWIIGPLLVFGAPLTGSTLVLVEGAPNYPDPDRMWRLVADHRVTYLGVAPTTVRTFMAQGSRPAADFDLSNLRILISAGEAWTTDAWRWHFSEVGGQRLPILNFSGGTEMISIIGTTVLLPLKVNGFNCAIPGAGADVVDDKGDSVSAGAVGELVMRKPTIGLTRGLWNDDARYLDTYWSTWPGIWHHGDFASRDADGQWYIHGRSDDTMKIAGKRTGPAEIEALLLATGLLAEVAAVGLPDPIKGAALIAVCNTRQGIEPSDEVRNELSQALVQGMGHAFRPAKVIFVDDLPKTRNMKIVRRVIRAALANEDLGDISALVNPESIAELAP